MLYQLAKTSVGLTGQVKWNLILNNNKVVDFQLTPIHESVNFNYTKREDTLNYTHVQNLNRLYKKIPDSFFETVVRPELNTGYPVRNKGIRIDTHENAYEMGLKRISYQRYGKQFAFFCPIWCDSKEEIEKLTFKIVIKDRYGVVLSEKSIDYSIIKDYISQFVDEIALNQDLAYVDFKKFNSWIKGIDVEHGRANHKNTLGIVDHMIAIEKTMLETDSAILNQFINSKTVCGQLFNFNFLFNIDDIIIPQFTKDFLGEMINIYVDVYLDGIKVPVKDMYSNYDFIPKYDIKSESYINSNCLDYLKDYCNIENITKNKLVQTVFHWALSENPDYMFNMYDGCSPLFEDHVVGGQYFNLPDLYDTTWRPEKNQLSWINPTVMGGALAELDIADRLFRQCVELDSKHWYKIVKNSSETFWINNLLYNNDIQWENNSTRLGTPIVNYKNITTGEVESLSPSLYPKMYVNVTFITDNVCSSIDVMDRSLEDVGFDNFSVRGKNIGYVYGEKPIFIKHKMDVTQDMVVRDGDIAEGNILYILLSKSNDDMIYYNVVSFVFFLKPGESSYLYSDPFNPSRYFIKNNITNHLQTKWSDVSDQIGQTMDLTNTNAMTVLTEYSTAYSGNDCITTKNRYYISDSPNYNYMPSYPGTPFLSGCVYTYSREAWSSQGPNAQLVYNLRSIVRTVTETLLCIDPYDVVTMNKSITGLPVDRPETIGYENTSSREESYYITDKFTHLYRYGGKLYPYFIDCDRKDLIYNNIYIAKQFNQQINAKQYSDADMVDFNSYTYTKLSPLYPSINYFSLRKRRCLYDKFYRGSRRYLGEKSWFKSNMMYVLPSSIQITVRGSSLSDERIKQELKSRLNKVIHYNIPKGNKKLKKELIFDHFIYPLYNYTYTFDYIDNKNIDKYIYTIKYTLK